MIKLWNSLSWLLLFLLAAGCSSTSTIVSGLDEGEANEIVVYLDSKGISAYKTVSTAGTSPGASSTTLHFDISVPTSDSTKAMAYLNMAGLPRRKGTTLLNIFSNSGLVPSAQQEKIRYDQGLADEIAGIIRKIDGILDVKVILSFPEQNPLNPEAPIGKTTASVFVKHNGVLDDPNLNLVSKIKRLVSAAIPDLSYDDVSVVGDRVRVDESVLQNIINQPSPKFSSIWGIQVTDRSIDRFRWFFFLVITLTLLCLVALVWMFWKCHLLIRHAGGLKTLFRVTPFRLPEKKGEKVEPVEEEKKDKDDIEVD